jgi:hypothetical protein
MCDDFGCGSYDMDGWIHEDDMPNLDHARDHMEKVLEALYGGASLNDLESSLEEVLSVLEMQMPKGKLVVKKSTGSSANYDPYINSFVGLRDKMDDSYNKEIVVEELNEYIDALLNKK